MEELGRMHSVSFTSNRPMHVVSGRETSLGTCSLDIKVVKEFEFSCRVFGLPTE